MADQASNRLRLGLSATGTIAVKDFRQRIRDRSIFIMGVVAPLVLALIFNAVFGGTDGIGENVTLDIGVFDADGGEVSDAFVETLSAIADDGFITLTHLETEPEARAVVDAGDVGAVIVLPATLSSSVEGGVDAVITVIGSVDAPITTQVALAIVEGFGANVARGSAAATALFMAGEIGPGEIPTVAAQAATEAPTLVMGEIPAATRQLDSATYFVAGLSIFFLFFIAGMAVTSLLDERRTGTLSRLLAAPIPSGAVVAGKSLTSVAIGLLSMAILVPASTLLIGADWGPVLGVAALAAAVVLALVAIMTLVGSVARTAEQAGNLQAIVGVTMAMLGGTFIRISGDGLLSQLSLITPNAWFLRGLSAMAGGGDPAQALPAVAVLLAMAAVTGSIGLIVVGRGLRL